MIMSEEEYQMTDLCYKASSYDTVSMSSRECQGQVEEGKCRKTKRPRRILHFSDGTLEEYSTEDEDEADKKQETMALIDPKQLTWGPWMYYWLLYTGSSALAACDYVGESLANFLGITSPKYQYEIDEFHRQAQEEEEEKQKNEAEMAGWSSSRDPENGIVSSVNGAPPTAISHPPSPTHINGQTTQVAPDASPELAVTQDSTDASPSKDKNSGEWTRF